MRICPTCKTCYEDQQTTCEGRNHLPLEFQRVGNRVIGGNYRLDLLLDNGGMGSVYGGTHLALQFRRAIKLLRPDFARADPDGYHRLQREALTACQLDHPNVVRLHDFGFNQVETESNGKRGVLHELFLVMELLDGQTLKDHLRKGGRLSVNEAIEIARQIAEGLTEVHGHAVIHRDLKPANIMLTRDRQGNLVVKILDFGSVKLVGQFEMVPDLDLTGQLFIGSPQYASPEVCCSLPVDFRSDIYSLGLVLYEMLEGRSPYTANDFLGWLNQHAREPARPLMFANQKLGQLIMRMLSKDPNDRPQSAVALLKMLEEVGSSAYPDDEEVESEVFQMTDEEETVVVSISANEVIGEPIQPIEEHHKSKMNESNSTGPLLALILSIAASVLLTLTVLVTSVRYRASHEPGERITAQTNDSTDAEEFLTLTDLNIRILPSASSEAVGLAEKGSRVRVLSKRDNWCEIIVVHHGRTKEDPDSADKGWVKGDKLTAVTDEM
jgi:serine/threonine protein kinase